MKKIKIFVLSILVVAGGSLILPHLQSYNHSSIGTVASHTDLASATVPNLDPVWPTVK
ncbi:hypothetical protein [Bacillus sp. MUM 13]|uniref:hypothetical protein n=1 Tax=Bacillus sp. MUM 13 TaxID=1678001 RepID=UPI00147D10B7|nr:hypothetical protein [Bacillus sp. MUM 13]